MSKWIAKLKDLKTVVLDRDNETYSEDITTSIQPSVKSVTPETVTLLDIYVPDDIEVSQNSVTLLSNSAEKNLNKHVPDGLNPPSVEVSQNSVALVDTSRAIHQGVTIPSPPNIVPCLPFALNRLVSAAACNLLSGFTFDGVPDINNYVRGLACDYLTGDQQEARARLEQVQLAREANS